MRLQSHGLKSSEPYVMPIQVTMRLYGKFACVTMVMVMLAVVALEGASMIPETEATAIRGFTLSASFTLGWNGSMPGPTIVVEQGDQVNLVLVSADNLTHAFFVSYTNSTTWVSGDPLSPNLTPGNSPLDYSFNATTTVGTYTYYCLYHTPNMYGLFKVVLTGTIPEFPVTLVLPLFMVLTLLAVVLLKRIRV